jgi:DNA-directed RNA polymerase subunit alpha
MIPLPSSIKITSQKGSEATFEIEGLYPGYGTTLGNALRRVLLSSLEGAAVTSLQIEGVPHEFSTLPGIQEDVVQIILRFKQLRFSVESNEPQEGSFEIKGKKQVTGKDLTLPSQVEIVNPDLKIATLTSQKAKLIGYFKIEKGVGYQSVEQRGEGKSAVGEIPIDSLFSPIVKVSYRAEQMRVGKRTDFDRLLLSIITDGTITPSQALSQALEVLEKHFLVFENYLEEEIKKEKPRLVSKGKKKTTKEKEVLTSKDLKIEDLKISSRLKTVLADNHFKTIAGLLTKSREKLLALDGLGEKGVKEIEKALKKHKLSLKED